MINTIEQSLTMTPHPTSIVAASARARFAYMILGWMFFFIGFIGAFLPVLPTTPLMILAAWAFARSSPRFHQWLYNHKIFGPPLLLWERHRVVPVRTKIIAVSAMGASFIYLAGFSGASVSVIFIAAVVMASTAIFILSRPSSIPK